MPVQTETNAVIEVIVTHFLEASMESQGYIRDPFGIDPLGSLIGVLKKLETPTSQWDKICAFVLKRTTGCSYFYFTSILASISPYVSIKMREEIVARFVKYGNVDMVFHITTRQLFRHPSQQEVLTMAQHHQKKWAPINTKVWVSLISIADKDTVGEIKKLMTKVDEHEREPDFF